MRRISACSRRCSVGSELDRRLGGVDTRREERLVGVDVSDPGQVFLVHDHLLHRLSRTAERLPEPLGREAGLERLGPDAGRVRLPPADVEEQQGAEPPHVAIYQLAAVVERRSKHRIPALVAGERPVVDHQRSGHARLHHQASLAEIEHRMLGAAEHVAHGRALQAPQEAAAGDAAQDVVVTQGDPVEAAAEQGGTNVADDGFDFGELGHCARNVNC